MSANLSMVSTFSRSTIRRLLILWSDMKKVFLNIQGQTIIKREQNDFHIPENRKSPPPKKRKITSEQRLKQRTQTYKNLGAIL